ncbi:MAG TPA: HNH endonuclease signature motif containing protein, partial [Nocardioidaceae bacterium]|nr:HNH endonuclease signature motif containing protein [Nocardioidaceae bacterium]
ANCDRPPAWTEIHHPKAWAKGGRTDIGNGLPLCPPHHHMADHPESWNMKRLPSGGVRFSRRQ